jgi:hypothetical protein
MMMNVQFNFLDGGNFKANFADYNPGELLQNLNDRNTTALAMGDSVFAKGIFRSIVPTVPTGNENVKIILNDNTEILAECPSYNAVEVAGQINSRENNFTIVGNVIVFSRIVKMVVLIEQTVA